MKQVFQNPKSGKTRVERIPVPRVKSGGVLVKNTFSLISVGTERSILELSKKSIIQKAKERPDYVQKFFQLIKTKGFSAAWQVAQSKLGTDIPLGYSSAGEVVGVPGDVEEFRVGDKVACAGQDYASHAEYVFVPKNLVTKIPPRVSEKDASFVTLGAIAMQGIRQANLLPGERVAVVGLGLLGQLASRILKAYGHPVMGFDVNPTQVQFAKDSGIDNAIVIGKNQKSAVDAFTNGIGFDAVLIYASVKSDEPLKLAAEIARDKGKIVQIGNVTPNIPWRDFYSKELSFHSSRSYGPGRYDPNYEEGGRDYPVGYVRWTEKRNMEEFLRLLSEKKVSVENLISRTFPIDEAEKAYELVMKPTGLVHGIVLSYPGSEKPSSTMDLPMPADNSQKKEGMLQIGLIGMGSFMTSTILPHLKDIEGLRVRAICHSKGLPAKNLGNELKADYVTSDYRKLIEDKDIDIIMCATRHSSHAAIAKAVLGADKHLYIEKPLALNEKELNEVMEVAKKSKGKLLLGFNRRFSGHAIAAREEFKSSATPLMIVYRVNVGPLEKNHWSYDLAEGGRLIGEGCHFVDLLQYITGATPKSIMAAGIPVSGTVPHEDNFSLTIEYDNGSLGTIVYSSLGNFRLPKEYIEIYGDGKIMVIDNFKNAKVVGPGKTEKMSLWHQNKGYTEEIAEFVYAIREGKPSPISLEELSRSHKTIFKAAESLKSGKAVDF